MALKADKQDIEIRFKALGKRVEAAFNARRQPMSMKDKITLYTTALLQGLRIVFDFLMMGRPS